MKDLARPVVVVVALLLLGVSVVLTAQSWFSFEMNLDSEQLQLQSFDGFGAFAFAGPIYSVIGTAIVLVPISSRRAAGALLLAAGSFSILLIALLVTSLFSQDFSGLASELETATGIAQAHGLEAAKVSLLWPTFATPLMLTLLTIFIWAGFFSSSGWVERRPSKPEKREPSDSIGIWDSQR